MVTDNIEIKLLSRIASDTGRPGGQVVNLEYYKPILELMPRVRFSVTGLEFFFSKSHKLWERLSIAWRSRIRRESTREESAEPSRDIKARRVP